ncbi:ferredoxin reductase family protein [Peterkaempfera griseoplana]|uniref:ferredoxin reductase family protein n=1 Tax=Peterkaempfera griseoplana TaxID=66896 RepID=UPI0006E42FB9|nr:ferredoxin reductase family protein [Peterkaempfera griseoplana]
MTTLADGRPATGGPPAHRRSRASRPGRTPPNTLAAVMLTLVWAGAAAVLALWWHGTPVVAGAAAWLTGAGRITGLLAGYAAPLLVLLMARLPFLERGVGADRLARWHAMGGRYMISLVAAHLVLVIWGYALTGRTGLVAETADIVLGYPEMLKATAGTVLLLGTGVVSARAARRRLSYEVWYFLHLATYLAVALAFSHQLVNGADFVSDGAARAAWYGLYLGSAALLGWYRLAVPFRLDRRHRLQVAEVRPEGPGVVSVFLTGRHLEELKAEPGQFFRLQFMVPGLRWAANPYSLSAPAHPRYLRFTVKDLGGHSRAAARLRPGTRVRAEGPYGAFTAARRRSRKVLLIGAGVGITPLRALFETLPAAPGDLTLLYRTSRPEDLLFRGELEAIAAARGAALHYLVGARAQIGEPLEPAALRRLVPGLAGHDVYLCGPDAMAAATVRALRAAGVPRSRIHHESFAF